MNRFHLAWLLGLSFAALHATREASETSSSIGET